MAEKARGIGGLIERTLALPGVRTIKAIVDRFGTDGAGFLSGAIAYSFFISMVPLLLLGLSILGYVLDATGIGNREDVLETVSEQIPGVSDVFTRNVQSLINLKTVAGVLAILGIIWAGTGGVNAIRHSLSTIFRVKQKPNLLLERVIALGLLIMLLVALVSSAVVATVLRGSIGLTLTGAPLTAAADAAAVFVVFRVLLPKKEVASRFLWPGAIVSGVAFAGLALAGAFVIERIITRATLVYGAFAGLVAILVLLNLAAVFMLVGAEVAAYRREKAETPA